MASLPEGLITLQGKVYATWPYVLNKGHEAALLSIESVLIQIPSAENGNVAIVKATVILKGDPDNLTFEAYGDASPANVKNNMIPAIIRLAETRAKGRAMRDAVNVGQTLIEELPEEEANGRPLVRHEGKADTYRPERAARTSDSPGDAAASGYVAAPPLCGECGEEVPANVAAVSRQTFGGLVLCVAHGRARAAAAKAEAQT